MHFLTHLPRYCIWSVWQNFPAPDHSTSSLYPHIIREVQLQLFPKQAYSPEHPDNFPAHTGYMHYKMHRTWKMSDHCYNKVGTASHLPTILPRFHLPQSRWYPTYFSVSGTDNLLLPYTPMSAYRFPDHTAGT